MYQPIQGKKEQDVNTNYEEDFSNTDKIKNNNKNKQLDNFQKKALHAAINYVQDVIIARKGKIPYPRAPFIPLVESQHL